jgi:hypothetical protein
MNVYFFQEKIIMKFLAQTKGDDSLMSEPRDEDPRAPEWRLRMELFMASKAIDARPGDDEENYLYIVYQILSWMLNPEGHVSPMAMSKDWAKILREQSEDREDG